MPCFSSSVYESKSETQVTRKAWRSIEGAVMAEEGVRILLVAQDPFVVDVLVVFDVLKALEVG